MAGPGRKTRPVAFQTPTLETERLTLRPFGAADKDEIYALQSDPYVLRHWDSSPWTRREQADRFIERSATMARDEKGIRLAVDRRSDGAFVGWCAFNEWNPDFRSGELGYCFKREEWGKGYATEAGRAVLEWMFENTNLNRVQSAADTRNPASGKVLQKLGFILEGTMREDCIVDGVVSDSWIFGLLRKDWEELQASA